MSRDILFHVPFTSGRVDRQNGVIKDVAVITGDVEAEGHGLHVDSKTVQQLFDCADERGQVPVNLDHGSGIKDTCGYLNNFRIVGKKLRADWHLLQSHDEYETTLERAERMPGCFGLSVKFKGKGETKGTGAGAKKFARCEKLISVDCVPQPAANPEGLFSVPVDRGANGMRTRKNQTQGETSDEPTLADILQAVQEQSTTLADLGARMEAIESGGSDPGPDDGQELTDAQIDALVAQGQLVDGGDGNLYWADQIGAEGEGEGEGELAGAGAGAGDGAGGDGAAMSAGHMALRQIHALQARITRGELAEEAAANEHAFAAVEQRFEIMAQQIQEFSEENTQLRAQNEALQRTLRMSGRGPTPSGGDPLNILFSRKDAPEGSFEQIVFAKKEELKAEGGLKELSARSKAIDFAVRNHREAYAEYRQRGGKLKFD